MPKEKEGTEVTVDEFDVDFDALLAGIESGELDVPDEANEGEAGAVADGNVAAGSEKKVVEEKEGERKEEGVKAKEVEKKEEEEEEGEVDHEARAAALEAIIEQQAAGTPTLPEQAVEETPEDKKTVGETPKEFVTQAPVVDTPIVFFEEQDTDTHRDAQEDPTAYAKQQNDFGNAILSKAQERTITKLVPMLAKLIPEYFELKFEQEKFYARNPELGNIRAYTGKVLNEVRQNNPSKSLKEQLELTKVEVYKQLKLPGKQPTTNGTPKVRSPKFAGPGQKTRPIETKEKSEDMTEMDEMLEVVA